MEINYIILAHQGPEQVRRLVTRLRSDSCRFYVHVDRNRELAPFQIELSGLESVHLLSGKREPTSWADIGLVRATLNTMEQISEESRTGYCILLSGQDYPIRSNAYIRRFLTGHADVTFVSLWPLPVDFWDRGGFPRITSYKIDLNSQRRQCVLMPTIFEQHFYSIKGLKAVVKVIVAGKARHLSKALKRRRHPKYIKPYGGGQWWALPMDIVRKIIDFTRAHPDYLQFHQDSFAPDEMFFQSIVAHLQVPRIESSLTYDNWDRPAAGPAVFSACDLQELINQPPGKLFARKFDSAVDCRILDLLDEWIERSPN